MVVAGAAAVHQGLLAVEAPGPPEMPLLPVNLWKTQDSRDLTEHGRIDGHRAVDQSLCSNHWKHPNNEVDMDADVCKVLECAPKAFKRAAERSSEQSTSCSCSRCRSSLRSLSHSSTCASVGEVLECQLSQSSTAPVESNLEVSANLEGDHDEWELEFLWREALELETDSHKQEAVRSSCVAGGYAPAPSVWSHWGNCNLSGKKTEETTLQSVQRHGMSPLAKVRAVPGRHRSREEDAASAMRSPQETKGNGGHPAARLLEVVTTDLEQDA